MSFSSQLTTALSALLKAGVPMAQSIEILSKQQEKKHRLLLLSMHKSLTEGLSLSETIAKYPHQFDLTTMHLIKAGEASGSLVSMLEKISQNHEKNAAFKSRLQKVLFYPAIVLLIAATLSVGLLCFVVPQFENLFTKANKTLPVFTQKILSLSMFLQNNFFGLFLFLVLLIILNSGLYFFYKKLYLSFFSGVLLKIPFLGTLYQKILLSRFAYCLSLLISSSVPIKNALILSSDVLNQKKYTHAILWVKDRIMTGEKLTVAFEKTQLFPPLFLQLLEVGEQSGQLAYFLSKIAELYDTESERHLQKFTLLLEPLIMIILGILIGGLVIGMYLPIFEMGNTF